MARSEAHPILKAGIPLDGTIGNAVFLSGRLPKNWRVWFLGNKVIQITVGERAIFETGEWSTPEQRAVVVVGPQYGPLSWWLENMETAHGTH